MYDCLPYFRKILAETPLNNLLVRACRLYAENAFIAAGFKGLANFTYKVIMPYLNFVEISSQAELIKVLSQPFKDLSAHNLKTIQEYTVNWTHVNITSTASHLSELDCYLFRSISRCALRAQRSPTSVFKRILG